MNALYRKATFLLAAQKLNQLPAEFTHEVGFAGRSNAGKSSAINTITGIHSLARTSKTPGRTQQIVYFTLDEQRALVDLPGYGFAKVPPKVKEQWGRLMEDYFQNRKQLKGLVLVMDVRHPLRDFDEQMLAWCHYHKVPVHILLTKADKVSKNVGSSTRLQVMKYIKEMGLEDAEVQLFSSLKRTGTETVVTKLNSWFEIEQN
ncbi:MAG: ribosome biogenesis GTP-binding protein YihA/YsxC [Gammaproteobacteria bacterium]|nr:ribosome biogenesis GTP-binding protein YihA/YsxC [Gammaproteobacteria bacterium]